MPEHPDFERNQELYREELAAERAQREAEEAEREAAYYNVWVIPQYDRIVVGAYYMYNFHYWLDDYSVFNIGTYRALNDLHGLKSYFGSVKVCMEGSLSYQDAVFPEDFNHKHVTFTCRMIVYGINKVLLKLRECLQEVDDTRRTYWNCYRNSGSCNYVFVCGIWELFITVEHLWKMLCHFFKFSPNCSDLSIDLPALLACRENKRTKYVLNFSKTCNVIQDVCDNLSMCVTSRKPARHEMRPLESFPEENAAMAEAADTEPADTKPEDTEHADTAEEGTESLFVTADMEDWDPDRILI